MIDIYSSRRVMYHKVYYWKNDTIDVNDYSDLVQRKYPNGFFYAKEESSNAEQRTNIGDAFRITRNTITIRTNDFVDELEADDIVKFEGNIWRVIDKQYREVHKNQEFGTYKTSKITYISLRR